MRVNDASSIELNRSPHSSHITRKKSGEEREQALFSGEGQWNKPGEEQFNWDNRLINVIETQFIGLGAVLIDLSGRERENVMWLPTKTLKLCYAISTMSISKSSWSLL